MRPTLFCLASASLLILVSRPVSAEVEITGLVDVGFTYNLNEPSKTQVATDGGIDGRTINNRHNSFQVSMAQLMVSQEADPVGFEMKLMVGRAAQQLDFGGTGGDELFVQAANVSYQTEIGNGLTITAGKFDTLLGRDLNETTDNWFQSYGFLYDMVAVTHVGVRATYPVADNLTVMLGLNNGADQDVDGNLSKSLEAAVEYVPTEALTLWTALNYGAEGTGESAKTFRLNFVGSYDVSEELATFLEFTYAEIGAAAGPGADGYGIAVGAQYRLSDMYGVSARFEHIDDEERVSILGTKAWEFTLTGNIWVTEGLECRIEYRHDDADTAIFDDDTGTDDSQDTIGVQMIYTF